MNKLTKRKFHVTVSFSEILSVEKVVEKISHLSNPQVVLWYIGYNGVRKKGIDFYRDFLIAPGLSTNLKATYWLVDLSAWKAFKCDQSSITRVSNCSKTLEQFPNSRIKCIKSAEIFKRIQDFSDQCTIEYFKEALKRPFIQEASLPYPEQKILTREIFSYPCPLIDNWGQYDTSKSYSIFQYLEGCLIVDRILNEATRKEKASPIQIVFALPNDELKYYKDNDSSFQKDVEYLLNRNSALRVTEKNHLEIHFLAFKYGSKLKHRPYNAPGQRIKDNSLL